MKIALVARGIRPKGGTESYLFDLVGGFQRAGHDVHVLTACAGRDGPLPAMGARIHRASLSGVPLSLVPRAARYWLYPAALARTLRRENFDLTISLARLAGADLAICGGTHLGFMRATGRRTRLKDRAEIAWERRCYAESSLIVAHSRLMQRELEELYRVPPEKIRLIHPPVNVAQFHPLPAGAKDDLKRRLGLTVGRTTLLFPSTSHVRKGLPLLIEALDRLPAGRFELAVAGSKSELLRNRPDVRFLGFVQQMQDAYRAADVTVLPSHYEPFGLIVTESIACGTPVVTHRRVGACDLVGEREGVVFDELNATALAGAIERASGTRFEISPDFCQARELTVEQHVERLIAAGCSARKSTQPAQAL